MGFGGLVLHSSAFEVEFHPEGEVLSIGDPTVACAKFVSREGGSIIARHHSAPLQNFRYVRYRTEQYLFTDYAFRILERMRQWELR
jgi:hypothetical protein